MVDRIRLNDMVFYGYHGVLPEEQKLGQRFVVSVEMRLDLRAAGAADDLTKTVNYSAVYATVRDVMTGPPSQLLEAVVERIAADILREHPDLQGITVSIKKPEVPIAG